MRTMGLVAMLIGALIIMWSFGATIPGIAGGLAPNRTHQSGGTA